MDMAECGEGDMAVVVAVAVAEDLDHQEGSLEERSRVESGDVAKDYRILVTEEDMELEEEPGRVGGGTE
jgi:hypothetical protein